MKHFYLKQTALIVVLIFSFSTFGTAQRTSLILERNVRASMEFLAGDALQGRGSGTQFEWIAAEYFAAMMMQFGIEPAGNGKTYIQSVNIIRNSFADNLKLSYFANGANVTLEHGKEIIISRMNAAQISGGLQKIEPDEKPKKGAVVFLSLSGDGQVPMSNLQSLFNGGASAVIIEENAQSRANWGRMAGRKPSFITTSDKIAAPSALITISKDEAAKLAQLPDGTNIEIKGELAPPQKQQTWNAVGKITGTDKKLSSEVILLSAHLDHLGVRPNTPGDDKIFNGADDDASGCVAVLELARVLSSSAKPKRTVYFAFYGSEEMGGYGSNYFVDNLSFPKENLVANLQFEMIGRPDAKVKPEELWLTGYDRSNLGPELAKRGAKLVADPHPEQNFFQRSDNYTLARQGIIAHTVSSFGLHTDYHRVTDEVKTIDFVHLTRSINSMIKPIRWLINSSFKPVWNEGKKP